MPASGHQRYDLVVAGGDVIDPSCGFRGSAEIGITNGRIVAFAPSLPPHESERRVDAGDKLICPGLIDLHVHVYEWVTNFGLHPDEAGVHSGATTIVDQGSAGAWTVGGFKAYLADPALTDVRSFVSANLAGALMGGMEGTILHNPGIMRIEEIVRVAAEWPELVKGIKRHGESGGLSHWGLDVLKMAVEAGRAAGLPLYVHTGELFPVAEETRPAPETVLQQVVPVLEPGTTLAHVYSTTPDGITGGAKSIPPVVFEALDRGLHFDIGHGVNFSFAIARRMMDAGVLPNTISSDVHSDFHAYHDDSKLDYSLCGAMTKLAALGMTLENVIARATVHPARILREVDEIGTLAVGSRADITVLDRASGRWTLTDSTGEEIVTEERLIPDLVIREGRTITPNRRLLRDICNPETAAAAE